MTVMEIGSTDIFYQVIQKGVCLVDFHAPWCAPCHAQEPILRDLANGFADRALICSVNTDKHRDVACAFGIEHVPTLIVFQHGREVQRFWGLQSVTVLGQALNDILG